MRVDVVTLFRHGDDAHQVAANYARAHGLRLKGNMRWRGVFSPAYREIGATRPGLYVEIRVFDGNSPLYES